MNRNFFYSLFIILMLFLGVISTQTQAMPILKTTTTNALSTTANPIWVERIPPDAPGERGQHAMAYDSVRNVTVMFGGMREVSGHLLNDTWELSGDIWTPRTPAHSPSPRYAHAMTYDPAHQQVVLFGGDNFNTSGETWVWDGNDWILKTPMISPPGRNLPQLAYDRARGVVVMYGGGNFSDTWEWDGTNWTEKHPLDSPGSGANLSMAYDSIRSRIVLFGISGNQTWEYDGNNWVNRNPAVSPPAASSVAMAYDETINRTVLLTSLSGYTINDIWEWDGANWTERTPASGPVLRGVLPMVYDNSRGKILLFGGGDNLPDTSKELKDTWAWDGASGTWTQIVFPKNPPASAGPIAYDSARGEIVRFGGSTATAGRPSATNETWILGDHDTQWTQKFPVHQPLARLNHVMVYDTRRSVVVLFGGQLNYVGTLVYETWEWDGTDWTQKQPAVSPSVGGALAYDADRAVTLMFTGSDTWEYDGTNWVQRFPQHSPTLSGGALVYDSLRHKAILFGDYSRPSNETWEYDGTDWTLRTLPQSPGARGAQAMAFDASRGVTVLFGGLVGGYLGDTWEYDGNTWIPISTPITPGPRYSYAVYNVGRHAVTIVGGGTPSGLLDDTWEYQGPASSNSPPLLATANSSVLVDEGQTASNIGTYSDADPSDNVTLSASVGTMSKTGTSSGSWSWSYATTDGPAQSQTVVITANDGHGGISTTSFSLTVNNVKPTVAAPSISPEPSKQNSPITVNTTFSDPGINDAPFTCTINYGDGSGDWPGGVNGNICSSSTHTYTQYGSYMVTVSVTDKDSGIGFTAVAHTVVYNFSGFFQPVDNLPVINVAKAGTAIPVRFSLGGNQSLAILAAGYPVSQRITCDTTAPLSDIEQTVTTGNSSLQYDATTNQYTYIWKTDKAWSGMCRQLIVHLIDGTEHKATFQFK